MERERYGERERERERGGGGGKQIVDSRQKKEKDS